MVGGINQGDILHRGADWVRADEPEHKSPRKRSPDPTDQATFRAAEKVFLALSQDPMTRAFNKHFFEKFKKDIFNPEKDHQQIAIIHVDINGLKEANDGEKNHQRGNNLIIKTSRHLEKSFRSGDLFPSEYSGENRKGDWVVRFGGDEFIIICHNDNNDPLFEDHLREKMRKVAAETPIGSFAHGVAVYDKVTDGGSLEKTIDRADAAMYEDKAVMRAKVKEKITQALEGN